MKIKMGLFFILTSFFVGCSFTPESEQQKYYTPSAEEITKTLFTEKGTNWEISHFEYYKSNKKKYQYKHNKKGFGYTYSFQKELNYSYVSWENKYEYIWRPKTITSYSGTVEVYDGKMVFHGLYGETNLEKAIQFSENGKWIKIGDSAYRRVY